MSTSLRAILRVSLAALFANLANAAGAAAQTTATLIGTVTDEITAAPLASTATTTFDVNIFNQAGTHVASGQTDPSGQYLIGGVAPGTYFVKLDTTSLTYIPELYNDIPCVATDCRATAGAAVTLNAGTTTIDFALSQGGSLSGLLSRAVDGAPVQSGQVLIYNASTSFVKTGNVLIGGVFVVHALPPGTYFARAVRGTASANTFPYVSELYGGAHCPSMPFTPDDGCRVASSTPVVVTAGATTSGVDFSLDLLGSIAGTVTAPGTSDVVNGNVSLYAGGQRVSIVQIGGSGVYSFGDLPPGSYRVRTEVRSNHIDEWYSDVCVGCTGTPSTVTVAAGAAVNGIDFALAAGGSISGTISCTPASPAFGSTMPSIYVYNLSGQLVRTLDRPGICHVTTPSVNYVVGGLAAGQYFLAARDEPVIPRVGTPGGEFIDQLYPGITCVTTDCDVRRGLPVTVAVGSTASGVNFSMTRGASSQLISQFGTTLIRLFDTRGIELTNILRGTIAIGIIGQQVTGIPPGTYYATFGDRLHGRGVCANCPPTAGRPIVVTGQQVFVFNFGFPAATTLSGTVRNEAGNTPLSTIEVQLYSDSGVLRGSAVTDLAGRYQLLEVGAGTYFLRTSNDRGFVDELYGGSTCATCDVRAGTPVVVGTADVTDIDFAIGAGGIVSGSVIDTTGLGLGGGPVSFFTTTDTLAGRAKTAAGGAYRLTLAAGTYRARAEATSTHAAEIYSEIACTSGSCSVAGGSSIPVSTGTETPGIDFTPATCSAMTLSPALLASGVIGRPYRQTFTVAGGVNPPSFQITSGLLPAGLTLTSNGVLSGTPGTEGRHEITVSAIDAAGCSTARTLTLDVNECAFVLSPAGATVPAGGGDVTVSIADSCAPQTVVTTSDWVTANPVSISQVVLTAAANNLGSARSASITIGRRLFVLTQAGLASQPAFGSLDIPLDGTQVSGSLPVGGWALDDVRVSRVAIYRDPVGVEGVQIYLGDAVFVPGARPDVRDLYPAYPSNDRAGWGFLILTNVLPNQGDGIFRIYAYADDAEGSRTLLGARTIVAANASAIIPFGAIDTPAQGGTVSGTGYINFGWALTPQPKIIPIDGSTIHVLIDGAPIGSPVYNLFRPDVSSLFPGLANSNGPVGYKMIDTTTLAEGLHTLAWIVSDNQGAAAGIGSRYFSVANSADAFAQAGLDAGLRTETVAGVPESAAAVIARPLDGAEASLHRESEGVRRVDVGSGERLELRLDPRAVEAECTGTWAGYLVDRKTLGALPVGSAIDPSGVFTWQPGPGFRGEYELMFVRTLCDGGKERLTVLVTIDR